jgi:transposase
MITIGFDVSKNELVAVRTDRSAKAKESFTIPNTKEEIERFFDTLSPRRRVTIAAEATGEYHRALALECLRRDIPMRLLNPITTKRFTRATVRKTKTDLSDALIIAKLALQGEGALLTDESFNPLKTVTRTSDKLVGMILALELMQQRLKMALPEEKALLKALAVPQQTLKSSLKDLRERVDRDVDPQVKKLLSSIPGIGKTIAGILITEIGTIERFYSGKALVAYAGLDPKVRQSGLSLRRNTRITKRGSPYLRKAIYLAATVARQHDPELKAYYEKKKNEGKRYKEACVAVARKLLYRVFAVWKRGTPYERYSQQAA